MKPMSTRRSSIVRYLLKKKKGDNHTFLNLSFETIPDTVWITAGFVWSYGGVGFSHCFENFSDYVIGALGAGTKTILFGGAANIVDNFNGRRYVLEFVTDGIGTDNISITVGNGGAPVTAPAIGSYECYMTISDIFQQSFFAITNLVSTNFVVIGISNGSWVTLSNAGVVQPCVDLPPPINDQWYHVRVTYEFATDTSVLEVDFVPSAITGGCVGGVPADLSIMGCVTGFAALGIGTPAAVYTTRFDAIDFNGIPDYVVNRNQFDLRAIMHNFSGGFNHSLSEAPNVLTPAIAQAATILAPRNPNIFTRVWISQYAYDHPLLGVDLIVNGTFEAGIGNWIADNVPGSPQHVGTLVNDLINAHGGARSMQLVCGAPTPTFCGATSDAMAVAPGRAYRLSYWTEHTSGGGNRRITAAVSFYNGANVQIGSVYTLSEYQTTAGWVNHVGYVYTPTNCAFIRVHFLARGNAATIINVDDVVLQSADLPFIRVTDVATGNTYFNTPVYTGEGWFAVNVQPILTGPNVQIWLFSGCEHGWVLFDNVRID